jgi:TetR/AcrR family transcriptional regulator, transcriptional repressor for nem operon
VKGTETSAEESPQEVPTTARGRATRNRIVAVAAELMHRRGVARTSLDEVIDASGTGKSQMYHYFQGKDDLVEAVVLGQVRQVLAAQDSLLANWSSIDELERWRDAVVGANRELGGGFGCPLGSLSSELAAHSETARRELAAAFDRWRDSFTTGLERMRSAGELAPDSDTHALATGLLAALQGGLLLAQVARDPQRLETALNMALDRVRAAQRTP